MPSISPRLDHFDLCAGVSCLHRTMTQRDLSGDRFVLFGPSASASAYVLLRSVDEQKEIDQTFCISAAISHEQLKDVSEKLVKFSGIRVAAHARIRRFLVCNRTRFLAIAGSDEESDIKINEIDDPEFAFERVTQRAFSDNRGAAYIRHYVEPEDGFLRNILSELQESSIVFLYGKRGFGKTMAAGCVFHLAEHFQHRIRITGLNSDDAKNELRDTEHVLMPLMGQGKPYSNVLKRLYRELAARDDWLIWIDDLQEFGPYADLLELSRGGGRVIVTTNSKEVLRNCDHPYVEVEVKALTPEKGATLLAVSAKKLAPDQQTCNHPEYEKLLKLSERVGGDPFFLEMIAGVWHRGIPLDKIFESPGSVLLDEQVKNKTRHSSPSAMMELATKNAPPETILFLELVAHFHNDPLPIDIWDPKSGSEIMDLPKTAHDFRHTLSSAENTRIILRIGDTIEMHGLYRELLRARTKSNKTHLLNNQAVRMLEHAFPDPSTSADLRTCRELFQHAMEALSEKWGQSPSRVSVSLNLKLAKYMKIIGADTEALQKCQTAQRLASDLGDVNLSASCAACIVDLLSSSNTGHKVSEVGSSYRHHLDVAAELDQL